MLSGCCPAAARGASADRLCCGPPPPRGLSGIGGPLMLSECCPAAPSRRICGQLMLLGRHLRTVDAVRVLPGGRPGRIGGPVMRLSRRSEVASARLLALDGLEQRLEVALAESVGAVPLDKFEEHGRPVLYRLGEDLQQIAVLVAVGKYPQLAKEL